MNKSKHSGNPFRGIRYIPPTKEILEIAFQKAKTPRSRKKKKRLSREEKIAIEEGDKISTIASEIIEKLSNIVNQFPWIYDIHPFYIEICDLIGSVDKIKRILGRIDGIANQIREIEREQITKLHQTDHPLDMAQIRRAASGRFSSMVRKADGDIKYLIRTVKKLKTIPDFDISSPTIVVAGAPNVGKSSLVKEISSGSPEIGEYPFTTKEIVFGHRDFRFIKVQIVDTPGLLDRPFKERNVIERQSIASIKHIADLIIFMFDMSSDTTISLDEQINLLEDIRKEFLNTPTIKVLNKIDILTEKDRTHAQKLFEKHIQVSLKDKRGLDQLINELERRTNQIIKEEEKFREFLSLTIADEYISKEEEIDYDI